MIMYTVGTVIWHHRSKFPGNGMHVPSLAIGLHCVVTIASFLLWGVPVRPLPDISANFTPDCSATTHKSDGVFIRRKRATPTG